LIQWVTKANEYKNRKNNKLIETLESLDYFKLSEKEALDLALNNNKEIFEIILEDEYEESNPVVWWKVARLVSVIFMEKSLW